MAQMGLCGGALRLPLTELSEAAQPTGGASAEEVRDYETADPSFMAVSAALRYWQKYHPGEVATASSQ